MRIRSSVFSNSGKKKLLRDGSCAKAVCNGEMAGRSVCRKTFTLPDKHAWMEYISY